MKVAYIFSSSSSHYILKNMIVPQLERDSHGFTVLGMFFLLDNTFLLQKGNAVGERLAEIAKKNKMLLVGCDQCVYDREIKDLVNGAGIGCFPDLNAALDGSGVEQIITL